jgi:hypothetical protein
MVTFLCVIDFLHGVGSVELAAVGVSVSAFNLVSKLLNVHSSTSQRPLLLKSRHWLVKPLKIPLKSTMVNIVANLAYYDILCYEFSGFCFGFFSSIILWEFSVCDCH